MAYWQRSGDNWNAELGGPFATSGWDLSGTGGIQRMQLAQQIYDLWNQFSRASVPNPAIGGLPYTPDQLYSVDAAPQVPGVPTSDEASIAAVTAAADEARAGAHTAYQDQLAQGQLAAEEIAAAKGKTAGSGVQNIQQGIAQDASFNLEDLLNQIMGVENQARSDVTNLAEANQGALDEYAVQLAEIAAQNAGAYNQAASAADQSAVNVLNEAGDIYDPYNSQLTALNQQRDTSMANLADALQNTQWNFTPGEAPLVDDPNATPDPFSQGLQDYISMYHANSPDDYQLIYNTLAGSYASHPYMDELQARMDWVAPQIPDPNWDGGEFTPPEFQQDAFDSFMDSLNALQLPEPPSLEDLSAQVSFEQPEYLAFPEIPELEVASLDPYINQFGKFELGDLDTLGGALNRGGDMGGYGRGGRGQWNIPQWGATGMQGLDPMWLQQYLASLGMGGF